MSKVTFSEIIKFNPKHKVNDCSIKSVRTWIQEITFQVIPAEVIVAKKKTSYNNLKKLIDLVFIIDDFDDNILKNEDSVQVALRNLGINLTFVHNCIKYGDSLGESELKLENVRLMFHQINTLKKFYGNLNDITLLFKRFGYSGRQVDRVKDYLIEPPLEIGYPKARRKIHKKKSKKNKKKKKKIPKKIKKILMLVLVIMILV